jgi:hypothetical protein
MLVWLGVGLLAGLLGGVLAGLLRAPARPRTSGTPS